MSKQWFERIERQEAKKGRVCQMCGDPLDSSKRMDTKFCSANCRKGWQRRRDAITRGDEAIWFGIGKLRGVLKRHRDLRPETVAKLQRARDEISDLLRHYDRGEMVEQAQRNELIAGQQSKRLVTPARAREITRQSEV